MFNLKSIQIKLQKSFFSMKIFVQKKNSYFA